MKALLTTLALFPALALSQPCDGPGPCEEPPVFETRTTFDVRNLICDGLPDAYFKLQAIPPALIDDARSTAELCDAIYDAVAPAD